MQCAYLLRLSSLPHPHCCCCSHCHCLLWAVAFWVESSEGYDCAFEDEEGEWLHTMQALSAVLVVVDDPVEVM